MSIVDLNGILKKLLIAQRTVDDFDISFAQPAREWSASLTRPTINCWLFSIEENTRLRSMEQSVENHEQVKPETKVLRNGKIPDHITTGYVRYAPRRFDFNYLVTAWSDEIEDEHKLLWRALALFCRKNILKKDLDLEGELKNQSYDIPLVVTPPLEIGVNLTDLWGVLDNQMHPGFIITSTLALDPRQPIEDKVVLVEEAFVTVGQSTTVQPDSIRDQTYHDEKPGTTTEKHLPEHDPLSGDRHLIKKSPVETIDTVIHWKRHTKPDGGETTAE